MNHPLPVHCVGAWAVEKRRWGGGRFPAVENWKAPTSSGHTVTSAFFNQPHHTLIILYESMIT